MLVEIKLLLDAFLADLALREQAAAFTWKLILTIIAIGLATLDLTFLVTQKVVQNLPPVTRVTYDAGPSADAAKPAR